LPVGRQIRRALRPTPTTKTVRQWDARHVQPASAQYSPTTETDSFHDLRRRAMPAGTTSSHRSAGHVRPENGLMWARISDDQLASHRHLTPGTRPRPSRCATKDGETSTARRRSRRQRRHPTTSGLGLLTHRPATPRRQHQLLPAQVASPLPFATPLGTVRAATDICLDPRPAPHITLVAHPTD
jgi:hypothetical protein